MTDQADKHVQEYQEFLAKAMEGDVDSLYNVGTYVLCGIGVKQDTEKAIIWFEKAAAGDSYLACQWLTTIYYNGQLRPIDMERAKYWYCAGKNLVKNLDHSLWDLQIDEFED
ncbi:MAG: hypothetical protein Tsb009_33160 [Planctomycetaceae bacterium]